MKYAHIQDGAVRELWTLERRLKPKETVNMALGMPGSMDIRRVRDEVEERWVVHMDGSVHAPPEAEPTEFENRNAAVAALLLSDRVVLRCYEAGVDVPADWRDYRAALRPIAATGKVSGKWPEQPAFPAS